MRITKENAKTLAEELKRYLGQATHGEMCNIEVVEYEDNAAIEVAPDEKNTTNGIYYGVEIVDFCRGRRLSHWISARMADGRPQPYVHIF